MGFFWGLPRNLHYALAITASGLLAVPVACAMFFYLTFGFGVMWIIWVIALVFGAPLWLFVQKPTEANREKRAHLWHVWRLCLIVHIGASAGLPRAMDHMPMSQQSSEGRSFASDYFGTLFAPVTLLWVVVDRQASRVAADDRSVTEFTP